MSQPAILCSPLIGFMGMYTVLSVLFLFLVYREIEHGPEEVKG
jgi:cytochrome d ubiquinol oxidase subunit I